MSNIQPAGWIWPTEFFPDSGCDRGLSCSSSSQAPGYHWQCWSHSSTRRSSSITWLVLVAADKHPQLWAILSFHGAIGAPVPQLWPGHLLATPETSCCARFFSTAVLGSLAAKQLRKRSITGALQKEAWHHSLFPWWQPSTQDVRPLPTGSQIGQSGCHMLWIWHRGGGGDLWQWSGPTTLIWPMDWLQSTHQPHSSQITLTPRTTVCPSFS